METIKIIPATKAHTLPVYDLIQAVNLPTDTFIKSTQDEVDALIEQSVVAFSGNKLVGVILLNDACIDTIVSIGRG